VAPITLISNIYVLKDQGHNVYAFRNNRKKNTIVVCAHHDHIGINEYENSRYTGKAEIHNGADDNASGVAAMLEMARTLKGGKYKKNNYLFIAFSGEELGLLGSKFFTQNPPMNLTGNNNGKLGKINYVINIDMLGRIDTTKKVLTLNGVGTSPQFEKAISMIKTDTNQIRIITTKSGLGPSDHASFYIENIPVVHFFSGQHEDYHKPSDDENLINYVGMSNSLNVMEQLVSLNNKRGKLAFTKTQDATAGRTKFKVTLGVMPDYSYSGKGMRIDGVTDGKPAQKAGLQKGDIIMMLGDMPVNGIEDYMVGLGKINPENPSKVVVLRGTETLTIPISFQ
jgi:Iap family predicted aminopeptidase